MFIKAGDNETKGGLKVEEATGERPGTAALPLLSTRSHSERSELTGKSEKRGSLETGLGVIPANLLLPTAPLVASLMGSLSV